MIVSIVRKLKGEEQHLHFLFSDGSALFVPNCMGCSARFRNTIAPVRLLDGGDLDPESSGAFLCYICSMNLPNMGYLALEDWPEHMTASQVEEVWSKVSRERELDAARKNHAKHVRHLS